MRCLFIKYACHNYLLYVLTVKLSGLMKKTNNVAVCPAKTQISLGIRTVWPESSLCAQWVAKEPSFLHKDSEDWSDLADAQADLSLCWAQSFLLVLSWGGSNNVGFKWKVALTDDELLSNNHIAYYVLTFIGDSIRTILWITKYKLKREWLKNDQHNSVH